VFNIQAINPFALDRVFLKKQKGKVESKDKRVREMAKRKKRSFVSPKHLRNAYSGKFETICKTEV
jgi:hypothetical protein